MTVSDEHDQQFHFKAAEFSIRYSLRLYVHICACSKVVCLSILGVLLVRGQVDLLVCTVPLFWRGVTSSQTAVPVYVQQTDIFTDTCANIINAIRSGDFVWNAVLDCKW